MISALSGKVADIEGQVITLDVSGVGYEVVCSRASLQTLKEGELASLVVYTEVKEDRITLYGFYDRLEKQVFLLLTRVKGVGAKSASDIISRIDRLDLLRIIGAGDLQQLQSVKGVGKKTAERIIVELRDKVAEFVTEKREQAWLDEGRDLASRDDAIAAMLSLGFSRRDAERAVKEVLDRLGELSSDSGEIVREALRYV